MKPLTIFLRLQNCSAKSVKVQQSYWSMVESRVRTLSRQQLCTTALITCPEAWVERHHPVILWVESYQGFPVSSRGGRSTSLSLKVNYYLIHHIKDKTCLHIKEIMTMVCLGLLGGGGYFGEHVSLWLRAGRATEGVILLILLLAKKANFTVATDKNTRNSKKQNDTLLI